MTPRVSINFVTYNSAHCLEEFFHSLDAQTDIAWEAHAIDNASSDASADAVQAWGRAALTRNPTNVGFGKAHNQNLDAYAGEFVLIANPDLSFGPAFLSSLVTALEADPQAAIAGPALTERGQALPPKLRYLGEELLPLPNPVQGPGIAWVHGSCFLIRRSALLALQGFDPDFFLYAEEVDLCLRARRAGWRIVQAPAAQAIHRGQQSQLHDVSYVRKQREFAGTMIFWRKHFGAELFRSMMSFEYAALRLRLMLGLFPRSRREEFQARLDSCSDWIAQHGWAIPWRILRYKLISALTTG